MTDAPTRQLIERFYNEVWNRWDEAVVREILDARFTFRGSIGTETAGVDGFLEYTRTIRAAFPDFTNTIDSLIIEGDRAAARLTYTGTHQGPMLGYAGTGNMIRYSGAAFFVCDAGVIKSAWVLGDLDALKQQLGKG